MCQGAPSGPLDQSWPGYQKMHLQRHILTQQKENRSTRRAVRSVSVCLFLNVFDMFGFLWFFDLSLFWCFTNFFSAPRRRVGFPASSQRAWKMCMVSMSSREFSSWKSPTKTGGIKWVTRVFWWFLPQLSWGHPWTSMWTIWRPRLFSFVSELVVAGETEEKQDDTSDIPRVFKQYWGWLPMVHLHVHIHPFHGKILAHLDLSETQGIIKSATIFKLPFVAWVSTNFNLYLTQRWQQQFPARMAGPFLTAVSAIGRSPGASDGRLEFAALKAAIGQGWVHLRSSAGQGSASQLLENQIEPVKEPFWTHRILQFWTMHWPNWDKPW